MDDFTDVRDLGMARESPKEIGEKKFLALFRPGREKKKLPASHFAAAHRLQLTGRLLSCLPC
jgi:hypothetical protein